MERRVVITGLGAITPIGNNVNEFWDGIKQGKCGIDEIKNFDTTNFKVKLAGEVKGFNPDEIFGRREARRMDRFSQFAVVATREAWNDSGLDKEKEDMTRVGVIIGSGIGGLETIEKDNKNYIEKGPDRVSPMYIPMSIGNMAAGNVAIDIGAKGESISMVTACASGTHCIGESFRMIKHGYQDIVIAGGTEASITPTGIAGFTNIKALTLATDKNRASIPFDKERSGFVMGEGAGMLVLEELEHAKARGAEIYAEIAGFATNTDGTHITNPNKDMMAEVMKQALESAGVSADEIGYVNAHGTGTINGDIAESLATENVFKREVPISSIKSYTGHTLGACGAIETILAVEMMNKKWFNPTLNLKEIDENCGKLDYIQNEGRVIDTEYVMTNNFAFGGINTSIILKKFSK